MAIKVICACGKSFQAKDELAGRQVKCPSCSQPLSIPDPASDAADLLGLEDAISDPLKAPPTMPSDDGPANPGQYGSWGQQPTQPIATTTPLAEARKWAMLLHFSLLAGFVIPLAGLIIPILIWQLKKSEYPEIDAHGIVVVNWLITLLIFGAILGVVGGIIMGLIFRSMVFATPDQVVNFAAPLWFAMIFYPLGVAATVVGILFPIIGGIKAKNGELWPYPLSGHFLD